MTISWSYGGTALSTFGVVTLMDDYMDIAERRGDNQVIPYRHGTTFVQKFYDERRITIGLAILSTSATAQDTLFDTMRALFALRTEQTLSCTREDSSVRNIQASVEKSLEVERITADFARVVVEFNCSSPYFRSSVASTDNTTTISTTDTAMVVDNIGTVEERDPTITLVGPLKNVIISSTDSVTLTYTGTLASTDTVVIQTATTGEYTATLNGASNVIGNVTHSGSSALLVLFPGTNNLGVKTETTGGTVKVAFYPPFL